MYDENYEQEYGFWRPVIAEVIEKFLECAALPMGLPESAVNNVVENYFWH